MNSADHEDDCQHDTQRIHAELTADLNGFQRAAILHALARFELVRIIREGDDTADRASARLGVDTLALRRLMDAAASLGLLKRGRRGEYTVTARGELLDADHPLSVCTYARLSLEQYWLPWSRLADSVRNGGTVFDQVYGCSPWEYRRKHPEQGQLFNAWQRGESRKVLDEIMACLDLSQHRSVADVAGGIGTLLGACLARWPHLQGILFEQPHTLAAMPEPAQDPFGGRLRKVGGDFFSEIPVQADCLLLKSVLHDWDDAHSQRILANCARAMRPGTRLIVIERVLGEGLSSNAYMVDLHMMMVTGGRERTLDEYGALAASAGLAVTGATRTAGDFSLIECRRAGDADRGSA